MQMHRTYDRPLMMWTWQDEQIERHGSLEEALSDMASAGFAGALAMLRGCRYEVSDPLVVAAARHAAETAKRLGISFWFALDPRLDQGRLGRQGETAVYLLPQRDSKGALPCEGALGPDGRYSVRVEYGRPRGQHMLSRVAITYQPEGVERVFAYRKDAEGRVIAATVRDLTGGARLFVQSAAGYLEIFGRAEGLEGEGWHVLALPRCSSNYPDLGSPAIRQALMELYRLYHAAGVHLDGVLWDEVGYVSGYGSDRTRLPYGEHVRREFAARHGGADLGDSLLWLLLESDGEQSASVRRAYYAAVQACVIGAQQACYDEARRLWGPGVESGIHQTWHQNANDLPHGSADWWQGRHALSGGYTDVGNAEEWERPEHGAQLLTMVTTAVTLARYHERPVAFCNLWGVNFGEATSQYPSEVMDWWAHLLAAFGVTWLAHTYGPNGYIDNFTNWGPGYPNHPSWERFPALNARIAQLWAITGGALPKANVAVVYPLEEMTRIGSAAANAVPEQAQMAVAGLMRRHIAVDVVSRGLLAETPQGRYAAVVDAMKPAPERLPALVSAPPGCFANLFERPDGDLVVVVVPADYGRPVNGRIAYGGVHFDVKNLTGIAAVRFTPGAELKEQFVHDGEVSVL